MPAQRADKHLRHGLTEDRDRWYACQYLPMDPGEREVNRDSLTSLLQEAVEKHQESDQLNASLRALAASVAQRRAARLIAAELVRRLHPEQTIQEQMTRTLKFWGAVRRFPRHNALSDVFSEHTRRFHPDTHPNRALEIWNLKPFGRYGDTAPINASDATAELVSVGDFFKFLKDPDGWRETLLESNRNFSSESSYDTWKQTVARKLVGAIGFLRTVSQDPVGRELLARQFPLEVTMPYSTGKVSLISEQCLNTAERVLLKVVGQKRYDEAVLRSEQNTQESMDREVLGGIGKALTSEELKQHSLAIEAARSVRDSLVAELEEQPANSQKIPALRRLL